MIRFALNDSLDPAALGQAFAREGRLQIPDFLRHDGAMALLRALIESKAWKLTANQGEETKDYDPAELAGWPAERAAALDRQVIEAGRHGFQFRYETIRLPGYGNAAGWADAPEALGGFLDFLSSEPVLDFLRAVTGDEAIAFADGHASRYTAGHFLTAHDDSKAEDSRRAAYVMNLTPQWRPDWGGFLLFYDERGNVSRGYMPAFNTLNLFRVPQPHSVSWVTPLAGAARHAVTGWLRAGNRPG